MFQDNPFLNGLISAEIIQELHQGVEAPRAGAKVRHWFRNIGVALWQRRPQPKMEPALDTDETPVTPVPEYTA
jgi:hypothetical protein